MKKLKLTPETLFELYEKTAVNLDEAQIHPPEVSPHPFHQEAVIRCKVARAGLVKVYIFSNDGKVVKTLTDADHSVGTFSAKWDGTNEKGKPVAPGTYFVQAETPSYVSSTELTLTLSLPARGEKSNDRG
jgi:hypothetical protein